MANSADFKKGYDEAVAAIRKALAGEMKGQPGSSSQSSDGRDMDLGGTFAGDAMSQNGQGGQGSQNIPDDSGSQSGSSNSGNQGGRGQGSQGTVTAADCAGQFGSDIPETPGGFMDAAEGNKLANAEGYDAGPGSNDAIANQWREAVNQAKKHTKPGTSAGNIMTKIAGIWNVSTDWKKSFRKIVGRALNTQDKRQAFANKNILATQNRVARTDKDKWDAIDYMVIFTDSSGSVSDDDLRYILSEVYQIATQLKPEKLVLAQFDTSIHDVQFFNNVAEFKKYANTATVKGRGGTDCNCCWELLKNDKRFKNSSAELVIIFTDGYLTQRKRDPKTMNNLCWAIFDNAGWELNNKDVKTTVVHLDTSKIKR